MPETSCMKVRSLYLYNMRIKQPCNRKVRDFAMASRVRKVSGAFENRPPGSGSQTLFLAETSDVYVHRLLFRARSPALRRVALFMCTVRPTVHSNPSRKWSISKTLFKPAEFEIAGFSNFFSEVRTKNICSDAV